MSCEDTDNGNGCEKCAPEGELCDACEDRYELERLMRDPLYEANLAMERAEADMLGYYEDRFDFERDEEVCGGGDL